MLITGAIAFLAGLLIVGAIISSRTQHKNFSYEQVKSANTTKEKKTDSQAATAPSAPGSDDAATGPQPATAVSGSAGTAPTSGGTSVAPDAYSAPAGTSSTTSVGGMGAGTTAAPAPSPSPTPTTSSPTPGTTDAAGQLLPAAEVCLSTQPISISCN